MENVYIHIPFCRQKCKYCSFISYTELDCKDKYLSALKEQIREFYKGELLKTLYFGGGTPSVLSPYEFKEIINLFNINLDTEITTELNPEFLDYEYFKNLNNTGINRLSFGCQTFDDNILKEIGRKHNASDVINGVESAQKAGFNNISIDFIYGLPNQNLDIFKKDLEKAINLNIQHISLYGLKIDNNCYYSKNPPKNLPDNDSQADYYNFAIDYLCQNNFEHYEISNFAVDGFYSKHNLNYWNNNTYYGFGAAAHGYENGIRYANKENLKDYIKNPLKHKESKKLSLKEILEEEIFLGFRKTSGIDVNNINKKFGIDFDKKYKSVTKKYISYNLLEKTPNGYKLTRDGILLSNNILAEFLE